MSGIGPCGTPVPMGGMLVSHDLVVRLLEIWAYT
jgi:hypothetical protein